MEEGKPNNVRLQLIMKEYYIIDLPFGRVESRKAVFRLIRLRSDLYANEVGLP